MNGDGQHLLDVKVNGDEKYLLGSNISMSYESIDDDYNKFQHPPKFDDVDKHKVFLKESN